MTLFKRLLSLVASLVLIAVIPLVWWQKQNISDWWRLRNYDPPARIVELAISTTMTDYGRKLFYVHQPEINDRTTFRQNCTIAEASIVLGCYISNYRIYVFDVQDSRLNGVHEVTAAHEMLHAAYDRLSNSERERIDKLTAEAYTSAADERLQKTIASYQERDPGVVPNELHSIMATEVSTLPAELEEYYKQYFTDRQNIVRLAKQYESAFTELQDKVEQLDAQLSSLRAQIEAEEASLENQAAQIEAERRRLDQLLAQNRVNEYNAAVPGFNQRIRSYNNSVARVRSLIEGYNRIVAERNAIATQENELIEAIDTRIDTLETQ